MTDFDLYVQRQAEQQANRPDSTDKQPLDFAPFESVLSGISAERSAELTGLIAGASIAQLSEHLAAGVYSSVELTAHFLAAIRAHQHLNAFLEVNPDALELAAAADVERAAGQVRGALHGIPVALKGNIATGDRMTTTAGARVLMGCQADRDAFLVKALRKAGAIIIGKNNLSEWANFYAQNSVNGYSTLGGHTRHPLGMFDVGGSSSGGCAAVRMGLVPLAIGSETTGSIVYPASQNGVVGLKPTIGWISRDRIIPITDAFDTAGPMGRTVADVAALMTVLAAGVDTDDRATYAASNHFGVDFGAGLSPDGLRGVRVGVIARQTPMRDGDEVIHAEVVRRLTAAGAVVVNVHSMQDFVGAERDALWGRESLEVMTLGLRLGVESYLVSQGERVPVKTLADIVAFNQADAPTRIPSGQYYLSAAAQATPDALAGYVLLSEGLVKAYGQAIRDAMSASNVAVLVDFANYASPYHSRAGFPAVTLPAGVRSSGEPLGVTFFGDAFTDATLLSYAAAFEAHS